MEYSMRWVREHVEERCIRDSMEGTPTAANVAEYVSIVKDNALLRRIAETAADLTGMIQELSLIHI